MTRDGGVVVQCVKLWMGLALLPMCSGTAGSLSGADSAVGQTDSSVGDVITEPEIRISVDNRELGDLRDVGTTEDANAGEADHADCLCLTVDTCCDGCTPTHTGKRCEPNGQGTWGICDAGSCRGVGTVTTLVAHPADAWIQRLSVHKERELLVSCSHSKINEELRGEVLVTNLPAGTLIRQFDAPSMGADFSPDGMLLAVGFVNEVVLYDTQSWETVWTVPDTHGPVKFSPAGSRLAAGAGAQAIVFDVASGTTVYSLELGDGRADLTDLVFTSDSSLLVTGTSHQSMGSPKGDARIWDMATGELVRTLECSAMSLALMADDATLAAACWSTVKAWNLADGSELLSIPVMEIALTLRFAPEEQHVAVGTFMGNVMVFEWKTLGSAAPTAQFPYPGMRALTYLDHDTLLLGAWKHPTVYRWTY